MEVKCAICGIKFNRRKGEINRSLCLRRKIYCSLRCSGVGNIGNLPRRVKKPKINKPKLKRKTGGNFRSDEFTPFRRIYQMSKGRSKKKKIEFKLTLSDLKHQWDIQDGVCVYTGWKMEISTRKDKRIKELPTKASIDRIDPKKGYIPGNIQFVAYIANMAKCSFPESQLIEFCKAVVSHH